MNFIEELNYHLNDCESFVSLIHWRDVNCIDCPIKRPNNNKNSEEIIFHLRTIEEIDYLIRFDRYGFHIIRPIDRVKSFESLTQLLNDQSVEYQKRFAQQLIQRLNQLQ
ncbi:hypothetical protein SNEBB_011405 [Seison nebaliae]|nr:hypothetical protein SNEBB_011405 [Seison nebaliae]